MELVNLAAMRRLLLSALALASWCVAQTQEAEEAESASAGEDVVNITQAYVAPSSAGLHWAETFDGDALGRWAQSTQERYTGKFTVVARQEEALVGDVGLLVPEEAKHYGASAAFPALVGQPGVPFIVQFEVAFQSGLQCGGSYIKLYDRAGKEASMFDADTPYVIMFGPDRCGATDKVHFILRHRNPVTDVWEEKHAKDVPSVPHDQQTHLYGLVIMPDNSFEILVDGVQKASGNLLTSMTPSVNPPKEIDDPTDALPGDWVHNAKMDDPEAVKPDDWDEDEPRTIADPEASMPTGWVEEASKKIPDPQAQIPADWDEEEDGEWEAPMIDNPACSVGCGKWVAPQISNPKYKGKWHAPQVDNPDYKGEWAPRQIANPAYFSDETPATLPKMDAVGIDIWTMQGGIIFDNIILSTDRESATRFSAETFQVRKGIEDQLAAAKRKGMDGGILQQVKQNPVPVAVSLVVVILTTIWCCFRGGGDVPAAGRRPTSEKKVVEKTPKEGAAEDEKEAEDDEQEKDAEKKHTENQSPRAKSSKTGKKGGDKEAGGLGSIDDDDR